jgi:hypothetical protein
MPLRLTTSLSIVRVNFSENFLAKVDVIVNLAAFRRAVIRHVRPRIQSKTLDLLLMFPEQFSAPKAGRIYRRPPPERGTYQASAAGEPPARRSGALEKSIRASFPDALTGQITISARYARFLEEGTGRMAARPFIQPAIVALLRGRKRVGGRR